MKSIAKRIPTLCGIAMIAMIVAAASHRLSIQPLIAIAQQQAASPTSPTTDQADPTHQLIAELRQQNHLLETSLPENPQRQTKRPFSQLPSHSKNHPPEMQQILAELVAMNRELRNQVAETNRDLMELQFQVDTHSDQFRPLNVTNPIPADTDSRDDLRDASSISVLPPID